MQNTRLLTQNERSLAASLWNYCFSDPRDFIDWYFRRRAGEVLAVLEEDELIAQIVCTPLSLSLRGDTCETMLLSGIATAPVHRHRGYMSALIKECFSFLRSANVCTAVLYPFDYSYYRHYGFAPCGEVARVKVSVSRLPGVKPRGQMIPVRGTSEGCALLAAAYEACFSSYDGRVLRTEAAFSLLLEELTLDGGYAAVYRRAEQIEGYILYCLEGAVLRVKEIGAASHIAREDLLSFLSGHSSSVDEVEFSCPLEDPLWKLLPDPRGAVSAEPYNMLRIVDVKSALDALPAGQGEIRLRIEDPYAPWNDGVWRLLSTDGRLTASKAGAADAGAAASNGKIAAVAFTPADSSGADGVGETGVLTIGELTQWVFGCSDGSDLLQSGADISEENARVMDRLLPKRLFFLYEMY